MNLTAVFEKCEEGGYTCWIEELPEAISQGETLDEARHNLMDALSLILEYRREQAEIVLKNKYFKKERIQLANCQ